MIKLTLQDFVHSLIGTKNNSKKELRNELKKWPVAVNAEELYMKWDDDQVYFYCPDTFLRFVLQKDNGYYYLFLDAEPPFTLQFEMTGEQLIKDREYKIIDFYE